MAAPEPVFGDTAFVVALVDRSDAHAVAALDLSDELELVERDMITTDAVLIEIGNYFSNTRLRRDAIDWIELIRSHPGWEVVPLDAQLLAAAEARYRRFADKNWSLTDCISMEVMAARKLVEIATTDHGFTQAGFRPLLA